MQTLQNQLVLTGSLLADDLPLGLEAPHTPHMVALGLLFRVHTLHDHISSSGSFSISISFVSWELSMAVVSTDVRGVTVKAVNAGINEGTKGNLLGSKGTYSITTND